MIVWSGGLYTLNLYRTNNPEWFYKKVLLTPKIAVVAVLPFFAVALYLKRQTAINWAIYERNAGHLSDIELLKLECKINPNRISTYQYLFDQDEQNGGA